MKSGKQIASPTKSTRNIVRRAVYRTPLGVSARLAVLGVPWCRRESSRRKAWVTEILTDQKVQKHPFGCFCKERESQPKISFETLRRHILGGIILPNRVVRPRFRYPTPGRTAADPELVYLHPAVRHFPLYRQALRLKARYYPQGLQQTALCRLQR